MSSSERRLLAPAFPDDTGAADAGLASALDDLGHDPGRFAEALHALQDARVLVPVVPVLGEVESGDIGLTHDKSADMAAVLLTGADGRLALLCFSSVQTLASWDPDARPVPVTARTAATAAVQEGASALLLDVAGPVRLVVEGEHLVALASGWRLTRVGRDLAWLRQ